MKPAVRGALAGSAGLLLLALHGAGLPLLVDSLAREPLVVAVEAPRASSIAGGLEIRARLPDGLLERVRIWVDGEERGPARELAPIAAGAADGAPHPPGMHQLEWRARYRGGAERRVGWTQLSGPYQDLASPPCSARLLFGQSLLDDGSGGPHTIAHRIRSLVERELDRLNRWPFGRSARVSQSSLAWVGPEEDAPGHLRAVIGVDLTAASLELTVRLVPRIEDREIRFSARTSARVKVDSRAVQWMIDRIDGDEIVSRLARREIERALDDLMTAPPPLEFGGGRSLALEFCRGREVEIVSGSHAAVWLALELEGVAAAGAAAGRRGAPALLPGELEAPGPGAPPPLAPITVELDGNALNGLLFTVWANGFLQEVVGKQGIADRFNRDPLVAELLSVRARGPILPLPPTARPARGGGAHYELGVAAYLWLEDGSARTPAHLFARAGIELLGELDVGVTLSELGLTCEPAPGRLEPCYPELSAELAARAPELHGQLSAWLSRLLADLLLARDVGASGRAGSFRIERTELIPPPPGRHGPLTLRLAGRLSVD